MAGDLRFPRINTVTLSGRLTRDPEVRYTTGGTPVATLPLAFNRVYKDNRGEFQEESYFLDAIVWKWQAEQCAQQLHKGSPVIVEGDLRTRMYENRDGQKVKVVEINASRVHFLEWTEGARGGGEYRENRGNDNYDSSRDNGKNDYSPDVTDDDVPF